MLLIHVIIQWYYKPTRVTPATTPGYTRDLRASAARKARVTLQELLPRAKLFCTGEDCRVVGKAGQ